MGKEPVYKLDDFQKKIKDELCYVNRLSHHVISHQFVNSPHRHDFYLVFFFTRGGGKHSIDFTEYSVKPNTVFIMQPGQTHNWSLSDNVEGYVFFHSRDFYEHPQNLHLLNELPFYRAMNRPPLMKLKPGESIVLKKHFEELLREYKGDLPLRREKLRVYLNSLYLDIARVYKLDSTADSKKYLLHLQEFQNLLEEQFIENHSPESYASQLKITVKHLNRVTRTCLGKTATEVIAERLILEAKRLLGEKDSSVSDVAFRLNFSDSSYFTRFFKKHTGLTPLSFAGNFK